MNRHSPGFELRNETLNFHDEISTSKTRPYISMMKWWDDEIRLPNDEMMKWWNFHDEIKRLPNDEMMKWWNFHDEINNEMMKFKGGRQMIMIKFWGYCFFHMTPQNIQIKYVLTLLWIKIKKTTIYHCGKQQNDSKFEECELFEIPYLTMFTERIYFY